MNDIDKAIDILKRLRIATATSNVDGFRVLEPLSLAISALEKQLPKPPEHKVHEKYKALGKNYYCSCGVMFVDFERNGTNFCGNCGQRLKEDCDGR